MQKFTTIFQHPFKENELKTEKLTKVDVLQQFYNIDWLQLNIDSYEKHDETIHDFYFFEVKYYNITNDEILLNIFSDYTTNSISNQDLRFWLNFKRPKLVVKKKLFGLLGTEEIIEPVLTEMENQDYQFAITCLTEFLNLNINFLEQNMRNYRNDF